MKKVTVLGNFSGRNAGDNAILGNLLDDITEKYSDIKFLIPTWSVDFVNKHFGHHNIQAMGLKPWNLAYKILGYPTYKSMIDTDLILITDNILFDRKYFNPLFNYLSTIALFAPTSKKKNIPILPYNASLGPITTDRGRIAMQKILDASPYLSVRDQQSKDMLDNNKLKYTKIIDGADCAINTKTLDAKKIDPIIKKEGLFKNPNGTLSFNINAYIDSWQKLTGGGEEFGREKFVELIANTLDAIIEDLKVNIMFTVTQVMDITITNEVLVKVKHRDKITVITNAKYTYQEITSLLSKCGLHVGMRTHSLILSSAALTPMITINAYPKSGGYVRTIGQGDWIIDFEDMNLENLMKMIKSGWEKRAETKEKMIPLVKSEQKKAKDVVNLVGELLGI
ncbi:MAG: polysaccharide pyruvyl transferase family protein [Ignavibacteriae bacterium]|nr:polysaccharide pyruvyl transferase family protein [Ignavibacteriota bacterium]MCB9207940.1 polysaccharide pyruvyl transferase family protein [Ignavibacteriales bacterium]MCB9258709.1 polysaccharide pyruvyl transferase family protein [Ignavibacteriales bacterium]